MTKDMIVSDHNNSCWGTNVPGHKLNVSGHNRVWAQSCGPNHVWAQTWWNRLSYSIAIVLYLSSSAMYMLRGSIIQEAEFKLCMQYVLLLKKNSHFYAP